MTWSALTQRNWLKGVHSSSLSVGKSGRIGCMFKNVYVCNHLYTWRRSEPSCLSWLTLILFSGLKPFSWAANRHDPCTHRNTHTPALFILTHQTSSQEKSPQTGRSRTYSRTHIILNVSFIYADRCGKHVHQRFTGTPQLGDSSRFMTQHVCCKKAQLYVQKTFQLCQGALFIWHER